MSFYVGSRVRSNGNSHVTLVDPFGNGVARRVLLVIKLDDCMIGSSTFWSSFSRRWVPVKGGFDGPCTNTFDKCFHAGAEFAEEDMRALQGIIPDMVIDARDCEHGPFPSHNDFVG